MSHTFTSHNLNSDFLTSLHEAELLQKRNENERPPSDRNENVVAGRCHRPSHRHNNLSTNQTDQNKIIEKEPCGEKVKF